MQNFREPVIIIDCEMTGLDPEKHQIIQISALKCDPKNLKVLDTFNKFVGPEFTMSSLEMAANPVSISRSSFLQNRDKIKYASNPVQSLQEFSKWLPKDYTLSGYNLDLDLKFINSIIARASDMGNYPIASLSYRKIDIADLMIFYSSFYDLPADIDSKRLEEVCKSLNIKTEQAHDSLNDCKMCREVLLWLKNTVTFKEPII